MAQITIASDALQRALVRTLPHASTDDIVPALHAVALEVGDGTLTATATDRYTLGQAREAATGDMPQTLLPLPLVKEMIRTTKQARSAKPFDVTITADGSGDVTVELPTATLNGCAVDAQFPAVEKLIPEPHKRVVSVSAPIAFTVAYVNRFAKVAAQMTLTHCGEKGLSVWETAKDQSFIGAIATYKLSDTEQGCTPVGVQHAVSV